MNNDLLPCYNGFIQPYIESDGTVLLCPDAQASPIGKLSDRSFVQIWRSKDGIKLRREAIEMRTGLFKSCPGCAIASGHSASFHRLYSLVARK